MTQTPQGWGGATRMGAVEHSEPFGPVGILHFANWRREI